MTSSENNDTGSMSLYGGTILNGSAPLNGSNALNGSATTNGDTTINGTATTNSNTTPNGSNYANMGSGVNSDTLPIILDIGGSRFVTTRETILHKGVGYLDFYFNHPHCCPRADGSYFIEADGDLFKHILEFLRTGAYPLFFDMNAQRFDYIRYSALAAQTRFFRANELTQWIENGEYHRVVKVSFKGVWLDRPRSQAVTSPGLLRDAVKIETHLERATELVYRCPRDPWHRNHNYCDWQCLAAVGYSPWHEKTQVKTLVVVTRVHVDHRKAVKVCPTIR